MAENKKSFILYADLLKSIEHLTNEEKGILFTHLLEYVNDLNPILEDRLILTAWKPIELTLKRDLKKFELTLIEKQRAGRIGNLKRWHPDLFKLFESGKNSLEELEVIALSRKTSHTDTLPLETSQDIANIAVTDNDIVNDSVNDNDIITTNSNRSQIFGEKPIKELAFELYTSNQYGEQRESIMMKHRLGTLEVLNFALKKFNEHRRSLGKGTAIMNEYSTHFNNWLNIRSEDLKKEMVNSKVELQTKSIAETYGTIS